MSTGNALPIKCRLPAGFLDAEMRSGYEVSTKLKRIWAIEIDLFLELSRVCEKHGIRFFVCAGTALGAIRHKGFIPWDDDMDVVMTRDDFSKLVEVAKDEFSEPYFLQTALSDRKYFFGYARLRNSKTTALIKNFESEDYNNGIYIDIFVCDGQHNNKYERLKQSVLKWATMKFCIAYHYERGYIKGLKDIVYRMIGIVSRRCSYEKWVALYTRVVSMYNDQRHDRIWAVASAGCSEQGWMWKKEVENIIKVPFEWFDVPIPAEWHVILSRLYGDYMTPPPADELGKWHESLVHFEPDVPYVEYLSKHGRVFK